MGLVNEPISAAAKRSDVVINDVINGSDVVINGGINESDVVINEAINEGVNEGINEALNVLSSGERTIKRTIKEDLLEVISRTPGVAGPALIAATGKGRTVVMEALAALRRAGKIEHRGSKKTGGYFTTEERK